MSLFIYSSADTGFFHVLTIVNNAAVNMWVEISFQVSVFVSFDYILRRGIADSNDQVVVLFLISGGSSILFSIVGVPIHSPTNSVQGFPFSTFSSTLVISCLGNGHSTRCEMISHCGFNFKKHILKQYRFYPVLRCEDRTVTKLIFPLHSFTFFSYQTL